MDSQKTVAFIFKFVLEVVHFTLNVADFHQNGVDKIVGLEELHLFKFYDKEDGYDIGWLLKRYKKRATNLSWLLPRPLTKMSTANKLLIYLQVNVFEPL